MEGGPSAGGTACAKALAVLSRPHPAGSGTSGGREVTGPFASEADASACRVPRAAQTGVEVQGPDLCGLGLARGVMSGCGHHPLRHVSSCPVSHGYK